uniref:Uncharacterized protein n=1 Tax=Streptomyces sp. NBC_00003 TaxID=2903608 RepID=A0AAU2UWR3_9ACTN
MHIPFRRTALAAGVAGLTFLGISGTAHAASEGVVTPAARRDACFTGACGSGTIDFQGPT